MAGGGGKPGEGTEELGTAEADTDQERGRQESVGENFQGGGPTGTAVWGGDVGGDAKNRAGVELIHAWGRNTDHGETAAERVGREMVYPSLEGDTEEAGFKDIWTSIKNRQNTVAQYIVTQPLMDLYEGTNHIGGARVSRRWWDQKGIDWEKAKTRVAETDS